MPWGASSSARQRTAWMRAAFEAQYAVLFRRTTCRPIIEAIEDDAACHALGDEMPSAGLGEEQRPACVHAERAVPLLRGHLEEGSGIERAGCVDEDVEAAVCAHDVARRGRRRARSARDRRDAPSRRAPTVRPRPRGSAREIDARDPRPAATSASAQAKPMPRCAPVTRATRPSSRHASGAALVTTAR